MTYTLRLVVLFTICIKESRCVMNSIGSPPLIQMDSILSLYSTILSYILETCGILHTPVRPLFVASMQKGHLLGHSLVKWICNSLQIWSHAFTLYFIILPLFKSVYTICSPEHILCHHTPVSCNNPHWYCPSVDYKPVYPTVFITQNH